MDADILSISQVDVHHLLSYDQFLQITKFRRLSCELDSGANYAHRVVQSNGCLGSIGHLFISLSRNQLI